jgi:hypothetical protein
MTQMTQKHLAPYVLRLALMGHPRSIHDPIVTQMTQKPHDRLMNA